MPIPHIDPYQRDPAEVAPTDSYRSHDPVWVYHDGTWRAGIIESASPRAAMVTYRLSRTPGTGVDTLTAAYLLTRTEPDPQLDRNKYQTTRKT